MPYKRKGKRIYTKSSGEWELKQTCKSRKAAKKALNLLRGVEHGWKPSKEGAKKNKRKNTKDRSGLKDFYKKALRA